MFETNNTDKKFYIENGYILKNIFKNSQEFVVFSKRFKNEIIRFVKENKIEKLGGYKSGNLNIIPGNYGVELISMLKLKNFSEYFNFITNDKIENYNFLAGGNLNLPNSKKQFFHTDGKWNPRMIVINIATSEINLTNGPLEIISKTHLTTSVYWKFALKVFFLNKKKLTLNIGDVLIREHRLWHRGTCNNSKNNREMIGLMFIKKSDKSVFFENKEDKELSIKSNTFGNTLKEQLKENLFIYFKSIFFLYKFFISMIK